MDALDSAAEDVALAVSATPDPVARPVANWPDSSKIRIGFWGYYTIIIIRNPQNIF